jgi:hypothetical protein
MRSVRTGRSRWGRVLVGGAATVALAIGLPVGPASGATNVTAFTIDARDGSWVGDGHSYNFTPGNATITASLDGDGIQISANNVDHTFTALIAPPTGESLAPGTYPAERFAGVSVARLDIFGDGAGCNASTGTLTILEVSLGVSDVNAFAATYTDQSCDGAPMFFGELRYNSTFDFRAASTSPESFDFGTQTVGTTSAPMTVTIANDGSQDVTFGSAGLSGSDPLAFAVGTDTCSGATVAATATCTIDVTFHPGSSGADVAQLDLPDDTARGARNVPLSGSGTFLTTKVTLKSSANIVVYGKSVSLTAHLRDYQDTTSKQLYIYATPYGGGTKLIKLGAVNGDGNLSVTFTPVKKTTFSAKFKADGLYGTATSAPKVVAVAVRISGKLTHFDSRSGKFRIYHFTSNCPKHHRGCPTYAVKVAPNHAGKQVTFVLQLYASGAWHTALTVRGRLGPKSTRVEIFIYRNASVVGLPTRVKVSFSGDPDHRGGTSPWSYFKVV